MHPSPLSDLNDSLLDGLQFCAKVYAIFEAIRSTPDGRVRLRMRESDTEKKLIEELLPICKYVQTKYGPGRYLSVRWLHGSQQFDGIIEQRGAHIDNGHLPAAYHLEVTCAVHQKEYLSRELLTKSGVAFSLNGLSRKKSGEIKSQPVGYTNNEHVIEFATIVLEQISKKIAKAYPAGTVLIIKCSLNSVYVPDEWDDLLYEVRKSLPEHSFREIFLLDPVGEYSAFL